MRMQGDTVTCCADWMVITVHNDSPKTDRPTESDALSLHPSCLHPFPDLDDLVRYQTMGFAMDLHGGFFVWSMNKTEDLA
jgi:hypothetical protein